MIQLFIRPVDTQFHRSGLPFDAGEDTETDSFFPPFPRTLYGALRASGMLRSKGCLDSKAFSPGDGSVFGDESGFGDLRLLGPVAARLKEGEYPDYDPCFPVPLDLVADKDRGNLLLLSPTQRAKAGKDRDPKHPALDWICPPGDGQIKRLSGEYLLSFDLLGNYLQHKTEKPQNESIETFEIAHACFVLIPTRPACKNPEPHHCGKNGV